MKIYVSVGTHEQPFQRLLDGVLAVAEGPEHEWVIQYGVGVCHTESENIEAVPYLTSGDVANVLDWADILISQASPGNVFTALDAGVWPLVLGRRKSLDEHVDDHQVRFARALEDMGLGVDLREAGRIRNALEFEGARDGFRRIEGIAAAMSASAERRAQFREEAWGVILGGGRRP